MNRSMDAVPRRTRGSDFLGIQRGTIRDVYTERTGDPTGDRLDGYQTSIAARCTDLLSGSPPALPQLQSAG